MNNFKDGDKVRRVSPVCSATKRTTGIQKDGIYTVGEPYGKAITLKESYQRTFTFSASNFELVTAMGGDDELPPAPESVLYVGMQTQQRMLSVMYGGYNTVDLYASDGRGNGKSVQLDATATLQLAHDLTRMAMEIKRKEKQDA